MCKYPFILLVFLATVNKLQGQTIINNINKSKLDASFERVKNAIPKIPELFRETSTLTITALQSGDSTATFKIEEKGSDYNIMVDSEKKLNSLLSPTNKDLYQPGIYMLRSDMLKGKKTKKLAPPRLEHTFLDYGVIWNLTVKKVNDKQTNLSLTYKSLSPDFAKEIEQEFKSDIYYTNTIRKIVVTNKIMKVIENILIKELKVDQDFSSPNGF